MTREDQTKKEALEILSIFKKKVLQPFKNEKWQSKLSGDIAELLGDYKLRESFAVGEEIKKQYQGFIPTPKWTFGKGLLFLFTGKIK